MSSRVKWGKRQEPQISQFDMRTVEERKLEDDNALSIALPEMKDEKKMMLFVDVVEKAMESVVTVGESGNGNDVAHGSGAVELIGNVGAVIEAIDHGGAVIESVGHDGPVRESVTEVAIPYVIDWDTLEITPILEHRIGEPVAVMNDEEMYKYLGLQAEDEQAEQARVQAENETNVSREDIDLEGAELPVHDNVPWEEVVEYDREDPPMAVGTTYATMDEFRAAVRQHGIKGQFELGTEKSTKTIFRGYCRATSCEWHIVGRLMSDQKQVKVGTHFFPCNALMLITTIRNLPWHEYLDDYYFVRRFR